MPVKGSYRSTSGSLGVYRVYRGFPKNRRTGVEGPSDQDYCILGSLLGSPDLWKLPDRGLSL